MIEDVPGESNESRDKLLKDEFFRSYFSELPQPEICYCYDIED